MPEGVTDGGELHQSLEPGSAAKPDENPDAVTGPVSESERITSLDVLRGVAVLGILTMNVGSFAMPAAAYFNPTVGSDYAGLDRVVYQITHVLFDLKFMAIFSMLFGAGIVLMSERRGRDERPSAGLHYRRMGWLLVFGMLHAYLIWYGDILVAYALCGCLVYLFRRLRPRTLVVLGLLAMAPASLLLLGAGLSLPYWPAETVAEVSAELAPPPEAVEAESAGYRGGFDDQMRYRTAAALQMQTETFFFFMAWRVTGLMLLGMALFKLDVLAAARSDGFYRRWITAALFVGVPVIIFGLHVNDGRDWRMPESFFLGLHYNYWGSLLVAMGWISVVMLACRRDVLPVLRARLAAVGRMAFTNYITQSILGTFVFYGFGLGLFGRVDRLGQTGAVLAIWLAQLFWSPWWLDRFRFGPLEWLWRSLVYWKPQPMRRRA